MSINLPDDVMYGSPLEIYLEDNENKILIFEGTVNSPEINFSVAGLPILELKGKEYALRYITYHDYVARYYVEELKETEDKMDIHESQR
jgi:hypothetical protein